LHGIDRMSDLTSAEPHVELVEMREHGEYRVCKDNHDPRGWPVRTSDDRELGKVSDLIIDEVALNARYLVCTFALEGRRILIPTGFARLDDRYKVVHLDFITRNDVTRIPAYNGLPLSEREQQDVEIALTGREPQPAEPLIKRRSD
jgi:PRC-barrel domain